MSKSVTDESLQNYKPLDFKSNNIFYTFKAHDPPQNLHSKGKTPAAIQQEVISSPRIRHVVREVAENSGSSIAAVQLEAQAILKEIAHKMALPAVRTLASFLRSVLMKIVTAIYVNMDGLELLSRTVTEWPVVLLPSHRSYLDFILVTYVMFEHNIMLPCIAAGQDFMSMRGISPFLRGSGAFFLRRTFGSDKLYKAVFSEYVKAVLGSGDYPMEFFVEGTRSRSGKSLHPKLGLLSMVMEPYLEGRLPDIMLVPISISYERTLEEALFARELLGVPKPKESTTALVKARSILSEEYGSIFVHVGRPVSLHDVCQHHGISRVPHSLQPREVFMLLPEDWKVAKVVGAIVLDRIHNGMKIFPTSLVATALLQHQTGLHFDNLVVVVEWIATQVLLNGGQIVKLDPDYGKMVSSGLKMLSQVVNVSADNFVTIATPAVTPHNHSIKLSSIDGLFSTRIEAFHFSELSEIARFHLHLAHYRNQLLHLFVEDAMMAVCLTSPKIDYDLLSERFSALHCALASEFTLPSKSPYELLEEVTDRFLNRGLIGQGLGIVGKRVLFLQSSHSKAIYFLQRLLLPFVSGVWVVCQHLLSLNGGVQSLTATVKAAQWLSAKCLKFSLLESYEVLSLGTIKNALASLHQAGLILQASNEFGTGKDRLVKVIQKDRLVDLTGILGTVLLTPWTPKL